MKIAFTHNLQLTTGEEEAEYDRPETVAAIAEALRVLGHDVEPIDVSGSASRLVARLEALNPDIIFNTAEGRRGRFREAFYPALFDYMGLPFTCSDAYVCALTLDKRLTKAIVSERGIPTPRSMLIEEIAQLNGFEGQKLSFPLIIKPNFEGSSMGITIDSIVENADALRSGVEALIARFPEGVLIEEFIIGSDLTIPYLEKASQNRGGVLEPAQYYYDPEFTAQRKYQIYDYEMKAVHFDSVHVRVPANITPGQREMAISYTQAVIKALGIHDAARVDYRIGEDGRLYFIEVNALPSFEPGASLYTSAARDGLDTTAKVLGAVVQSAADRYGLALSSTKRPRRRGKVRVGLAFNLRHAERPDQDATDSDAEYDTPETISAIRQAIESYGHEVVELEATPELPSILPNVGVDVVFNMAEGLAGRTRESQVPALLELLGIPYTGSDPTTLSLALDKGLAKRLVSQAGLKTPPFILMISGKERVPKAFRFPAIIKPVAEGSSKGIVKKSVVENETELRELVQEVMGKYRQAVIAESYLPGREFTVALLGERRPRVLPPMEVVFPDDGRKHAIYSFESKFIEKTIRFEAPAKIDAPLRREMERVARSIFAILDCRDLARVDFRLDENGQVNFIECNPLPGLTPGFSDFCVIAEAAGISYRALIGEILAPALRRMRERNREKLIEGRG